MGLHRWVLPGILVASLSMGAGCALSAPRGVAEPGPSTVAPQRQATDAVQTASGTGKRSNPWDDLVAGAVHAALLSEPDGLKGAAAEARKLEKEEQAGKREPSGVSTPQETSSNRQGRGGSAAGEPIPHIVDQLSLLTVLADSPPLPTAKEANKALSGTHPDQSCLAAVEMLNEVEPRSRLAVAKKTALYVELTSPFNAVAQLAMSALQGQLYSVVESLSGWVESAFQYPYPTPEEREVLRAERDLLDDPFLSANSPDLRRTVERGLKARRELGCLQAIENGDRAAEQGALDRALWWYGRAKLLVPGDSSAEKRIVRVSTDLNRTIRGQQDSLTVTRGEDAIGDNSEWMEYAAFVRAYTEDPTGEETGRLRDAFLSRYPASPVADEVRLSEVAAYRETGKLDSARVLAEWLASKGTTRGTRVRAALLARDPRFAAPADFSRACGQERKEWWNFLVFGDRPVRPEDERLTAEQARVRRAAWLRYFSPLFVTDIANRLFLLPFGWPLDHEPTLAAVARWTPPPSDDPLAGERARRRADDLYSDGRYNEADRAYRSLSPPDTAMAGRSREKAARQRFDQIQKTGNPSRRAAELEQFLGAFPNSRMASAARTALDKAKGQRSLVAVISRKELVATPALRAKDALDLPNSLFDGNSGNGELGKGGVQIHEANRIRYRDASSGKVVERELTEPQVRRTLSLLDWERRPGELAAGRERTRRLYRVPLEVEATALPGIEASPGFVPPRERVDELLYE